MCNQSFLSVCLNNTPLLTLKGVQKNQQFCFDPIGVPEKQSFKNWKRLFFSELLSQRTETECWEERWNVGGFYIYTLYFSHFGWSCYKCHPLRANYFSAPLILIYVSAQSQQQYLIAHNWLRHFLIPLVSTLLSGYWFFLATPEVTHCDILAGN